MPHTVPPWVSRSHEETFSPLKVGEHLSSNRRVLVLEVRLHQGPSWCGAGRGMCRLLPALPEPSASPLLVLGRTKSRRVPTEHFVYVIKSSHEFHKVCILDDHFTDETTEA